MSEKIQNRARKSIIVAVLLGLFFPPLAYFYVGKKTWAVVNIFTVDFFLLGIVIVPVHVAYSIKQAEHEVKYDMDTSAQKLQAN